ncbi:monovalent cation/H(+) antiporter subunit G [Alkalilacustris brevis]|uniref:monovalent cation/H(+) antiporter subunit G n=1 Tax=Alkalilacustris brevis TaxID=2026338 RepID=UPI000E0D7B9A|nr:monovalent cation/H(+) antiporter subunit G [Alkalilacustris brevis]
MTEPLTAMLVGLGLVFFLAGTLGLIRLPDTFSRLHALTKADNLGLGFIVLGLALQADDWNVLGKLVLIWAFALIAAGTSAQLVARSALRRKSTPSERQAP